MCSLLSSHLEQSCLPPLPIAPFAPFSLLYILPFQLGWVTSILTYDFPIWLSGHHSRKIYVITGNCFSTKMSVACLGFEIFPVIVMFVCLRIFPRQTAGGLGKKRSFVPRTNINFTVCKPKCGWNMIFHKKIIFGDNWCLSCHCIGWASLGQHESILAQEPLIGVKISFITFLFAVQDDLMMAGSMCWQTCHFHFFVHPCYVGESDTFVCFNRAGKQLDSCMACGIVSFFYIRAES